METGAARWNYANVIFGTGLHRRREYLCVWLQLRSNAHPDRLQAFLADVGQQEDFAEVEKKALALGAERMIIQNLQQEFVDELIWPAIQCTSRFRLQQHILVIGGIGRLTQMNQAMRFTRTGEFDRNFVAFAIAFL